MCVLMRYGSCTVEFTGQDVTACHLAVVLPSACSDEPPVYNGGTKRQARRTMH